MGARLFERLWVGRRRGLPGLSWHRCGPRPGRHWGPRGLAAGGWGWAEPFSGLRAFDTDMSRVFFGRRAEVNEVAELLQSPADRPGAGPGCCR